MRHELYGSSPVLQSSDKEPSCAHVCIIKCVAQGDLVELCMIINQTAHTTTLMHMMKPKYIGVLMKSKSRCFMYWFVSLTAGVVVSILTWIDSWVATHCIRTRPYVPNRRSY